MKFDQKSQNQPDFHVSMAKTTSKFHCKKTVLRAWHDIITFLQKKKQKITPYKWEQIDYRTYNNKYDNVKKNQFKKQSPGN